MPAALTRSQLASLIASERDSFRVLHRLTNAYNTRVEHFWQKDGDLGRWYFYVYYPLMGIFVKGHGISGYTAKKNALFRLHHSYCQKIILL